MAPINRSNNLVKITKELLNNDNLNATIEKLLPNNYDFEIHRTIAKIRVTNAKRIALQMPEGLLLFSCIIADILTKFAYENGDEIDVIVMGDVTYGACCIDDYTSRALQCDLLVHYGHSCLVSLDTTNTFYVFVYISIDTKHFLDTINTNFSEGCHLILVSTVQFISTLQAVRDELSKKFRVTIPKIAPLSFGEILGCTAPTIASSDTDCIIYLGDGRFHLEAVMMANPDTPAYRYDPYAKVITHEYYDHDTMRRNRNQSIAIAREARTFGIILGTLGRQGSSAVLESIKTAIEKSGRSHVTILLSEVFPAKLALFGDAIDAFIQIACPRLSIDWGTFFKKPLLTPFEACVALGVAQWTPSQRYPMDFYAHDSLGNWTPNHRPGGPDARRGRPQKKHIVIGETKAPTDLIQVQIEQVTGDACAEHEWVGCTNCTCSNIAE